MNALTHRGRRTLALIAAAVFLVASALTANAARRATDRDDFKAGPIAARLVIDRVANLGHNVIVDLRINDGIGRPIVYGHTFEALLPPGRHVVSLLPTPGPRWLTPSETIVDVRAGRTYYFTVATDHSGHLILKGE